MNSTFRTRPNRARAALLGTTVLAGGMLMLAAAPAFAQETGAIETVTVTGYRASLESSTNAKRAAVGFSDTVFAEDIGKFPDANIAEALNRVPGINIKREADNEGLQVAIRGLGANFTKILLNGAPISVASTGATDQNTNNREVDLNMFPTELFTQLTVAKSPTADMIEGGLAGVVTMRTMRPFDNPGMHLTYNAQATEYSQGATLGERGTLIFSDTAGPFGALVGVSVVHNKVYATGWEDGNAGWYTPGGLTAAQCGAGNTCDTTGGNEWTPPATVLATVSPITYGSTTIPVGSAAVSIPIPGGSGYYPAGTPIDAAWLLLNNPAMSSTNQLSNVMVPRLGREMYEYGSRDRANAVVSLEYRPTDNLHFYFDAVLGRIVNSYDRSDLDVGFRSGSATTPIIPVGLVGDKNNVLTDGTFYNATFFLESRPYREHEDFFSLNPGVSWQVTDMLKVDAQINASRSHFFRDQSDLLVVTPPSQGYATGVSGPNAQAVTSDHAGVWFKWSNHGSYPIVTSNLNLNDPSIYGWATYQNAGRVDLALERRYTFTDGAHVDLTYGDEWFNVKVGGSFDDIFRNISAVSGSQIWQNAVCGDNPSINIPGQSGYPGCQGLNDPTPNAAGHVGGYPTYPGYGTGYTAGQTGTLTWGGSLVTEAMVPSELKPGPRGWVTLNMAKFYADSQYQKYKALSLAGLTPQTIKGHANMLSYAFSTSTVAGGGNSGQFEEKVWGYYVEANGKFEIYGHPLKYNVGFRWVETHEDVTSPVVDATVTVDNASLSDGGKWPGRWSWGSAKSVSQTYLPSGALVYELADNMIIRASMSRTMGRANPNQMVSNINFNDIFAQQANLGNPGLKPYFSTNLDIGGEYYTGGEGYIGVTGFRKGVSGWPISSSFNTTFSYLAQYGIVYDSLSQGQKDNLSQNSHCNSDATCANAPLKVNTQLNAPGSLVIEGVELDYVQPLDFLLEDLGLKGFGFNGNLTAIRQHSKGAAPVHAGGVPAFSYNATGYYENNGLMVRVSYAFTGKAHQANPGAQVNQCFPNTSYSSTAAGCQGPWYYDASHGQVDLSASMELAKLFGQLPSDPEVTLDIQNLNHSKIRNFVQFWNAPHFYYDPGTFFMLGVRGKF